MSPAGESLSPEQMLAEVENLLRSMPPGETIRHELPETFSRLGRVAAVISMWNPAVAIRVQGNIQTLQRRMAEGTGEAIRSIIITLHQAQHDLRLRTAGPINVATSKGAHFDYFDAIKNIVQQAKIDLLFVDPYLDADFVGQYLPLIDKGVNVRLLTTDKKLATLLPAIDAFVKQHGIAASVGEDSNLHDRYVLVDGLQCYQSGASFKDGPRNADTTVTQIVDLFAEVKSGYEKRWQVAKQHR